VKHGLNVRRVSSGDCRKSLDDLLNGSKRAFEQTPATPIAVLIKIIVILWNVYSALKATKY
jgi:hypothetical protein